VAPAVRTTPGSVAFPNLEAFYQIARPGSAPGTVQPLRAPPSADGGGAVTAPAPAASAPPPGSLAEALAAQRFVQQRSSNIPPPPVMRVELQMADRDHVGLKTRYHTRLYTMLRTISGHHLGTLRAHASDIPAARLDGMVVHGGRHAELDHEANYWKFPKSEYHNLGTLGCALLPLSLSPRLMARPSGGGWFVRAVAKLEAFGQGPQADLVLEFDKIPAPILELFNIGSRRSSAIDSDERLAATYGRDRATLLRCALTPDRWLGLVLLLLLLVLLLGWVVEQHRHAGRLADPAHARGQPAAVPA